MVKISDISDKLKLSRVTVSAILNDRYRKLGISERTAEMVRKVAKDVGYLPNLNALSMKTGRSMTIGMISSSLSEEWGANILVGALSAIRNTPYSLLIESVHGALAERAALDRLLGSRIEGLFCCNINPVAEVDTYFQDATARYGVSLASTNCSFSFPHARVEVDNEKALMLQIDHLVEHGHRRIAHLGGDQVSESSRERSEAFLRGVDAFGLDPLASPVLFGDWEAGRTRELATRLLTSGNRPTAVVCANDFIAACVLQVAAALKLRVPEELSVVGMTNERLSCLTIPSITTVNIPEEAIGAGGIEFLVGAIESEQTNVVEEARRYPCSLVVRGSSGPALKI